MTHLETRFSGEIADSVFICNGDMSQKAGVDRRLEIGHHMEEDIDINESIPYGSHSCDGVRSIRCSSLFFTSTFVRRQIGR